MPQGFEMLRDNEQSTVYENGEYEVTLKKRGYAFKRTKDQDYIDEDADVGEMVPVDILIARNKATGRKSQKRIFQPPLQALKEFEADASGDKSQFKTIFNRIDPKNK